jgi:hypothetical protein
MNDETWTRSEIESPCVKLCLIHPEAQLCTGCLRSLEEIAGWSRMVPEDRRRIMASLPDRQGRLSQRRGGRSARLSRQRPEPQG